MKQLENILPLVNKVARAQQALVKVYKGVWAMIDDGLQEDDINEYLFDIIGRAAAKEFKTWKPIIQVERREDNTAGSYNHAEGRIKVNTRLINPADAILDGDFLGAINCLSTVVHEMKHLQQWIYRPSIFDDYIDATDDYEGYREHISEVEARQAEKAFRSKENRIAIMEHIGNIICD